MMQEFVQQIKNLIAGSIGEIHTAMPGTVVSFDASTGLASVQPAMKFRKPDGTTMDFPYITGVPVVFPQAWGQEATIAFPVKAGDGCLLIVAEQSIDYWLYGQETGTDLPFNLTNAICIPGLYPAANTVMQEACEHNAVIIDVQGTRIRVKKDLVEITASSVTINGDVTVNGSLAWQS